MGKNKRWELGKDKENIRNKIFSKNEKYYTRLRLRVDEARRNQYSSSFIEYNTYNISIIYNKHFGNAELTKKYKLLIWLNDQWYTYIPFEYVLRVTLIIIQNCHVMDLLVSSRAFYYFSYVSFVILCFSKRHKHSRCFADLLQRQQCAKMRWYSDNACTCLSVKLIYKNHSFDRKEKIKDFSSLPSSTSTLPRPKKEMKNVTRKKNNKKKIRKQKQNLACFTLSLVR